MVATGGPAGRRRRRYVPLHARRVELRWLAVCTMPERDWLPIATAGFVIVPPNGAAASAAAVRGPAGRCDGVRHWTRSTSGRRLRRRPRRRDGRNGWRGGMLGSGYMAADEAGQLFEHDRRVTVEHGRWRTQQVEGRMPPGAGDGDGLGGGGTPFRNRGRHGPFRRWFRAQVPPGRAGGATVRCCRPGRLIWCW